MGDPDRAKAPSPTVTTVLEDGLSCRIGGPFGDLRTDMPALLGGGATAPSPGWLLRGAIASCTATVIAMRAAQLGITLDLLEVSVTCGGDARGMLGLDEAVSAAMTDIRVGVRIGAEETPHDVLVELVRWAEAHAPVMCTIRSGHIQPAEIQVRSACMMAAKASMWPNRPLPLLETPDNAAMNLWEIPGHEGETLGGSVRGNRCFQRFPRLARRVHIDTVRGSALKLTGMVGAGGSVSPRRATDAATAGHGKGV